VLLATGSAFADDKQQCAAAYTDAQSLRDAHKLVEEREKLRVCSQSTCAAFMQKDCTAWLAQVESTLPSIVILAHTATGDAVVDASVMMDGMLLTSRLDGRAIDVNPGVHTFILTTAHNEQTSVTAVVSEGQRAQQIVATFGHAPSSSQQQPTTPPPPPKETPTASGSSPLRPIGYVTLGVGVASVVTGSILGLVASATKGSSCDQANVCTPGSISTLYAEANTSTATLIAGGVLVAAGITFIILGHPRASASTALRVVPFVGTSSGLAVGGVF
jgi:hypothetical protein